MKSTHHLPSKRAIFPPQNQLAGACIDIPGAAYAFNAASLPMGPEESAPFPGVEFQPSKLCPRNFIIFDQTDFQSRVLFHPAIAPKFTAPAVQTRPTYVENKFHMLNEEREVSSPNQEDSNEINALLSLDDDDDADEDCEEYDEDEMSTARTYGNYGSSSPDSCSNYGSKSNLKFGISSLLPKSSSSGSSCSSGTKKQKMKRMVKALRGIVPGGHKMSTITLLDEAVKYLKSLKVEAQKFGDTKN